MAERNTPRAWQLVRPDLAPELSDARLQLHHAAQLVSAIGISYLPHQANDSHTNLEWLGDLAALASHTIDATRPIRLGVRPNPFALLFLQNDVASESFALPGRTVAEAADWVRGQVSANGADGAAYTLAKHFTIPEHAVARSAPFNDGDTAAFRELALWYADAALVLSELASATPNSSPVRCWPHHFDIATLIEVAPGKTISLGMEPGDTYYAEPYFYASMYPSPAQPPTSTLEGGGSWHTRDWIGAVLPGSRVLADGQESQVSTFLASAVASCRSALLAR
jgi:hypothetical protein